MEVLKILKAPEIFDKNYLIMVPNKSKRAVAPYLFDTLEDAKRFLDSIKPDPKEFWWNKD